MDSSFPTDCARLYLPVRLLARGGYGAVWEATHRSLNSAVAVKVFLGADVDEECGAERFLDEARVTSKLAHPCIVRVVELGAAGDQPWIAYELLPGPTLRERMNEARLPLDEALEVGAAIASALEEAHHQGVVHRDVKPENVLAAGDGRWKVTDFGIAKWSGGRVHTRTGMVLGTPIYIAPESLQGERITTAVDVYALGVLLYEMLSGAPPFPGEHPVEIMRQHVETIAPPVTREDVPDRVKRLVSRMLAKDPAARPDASTVRAELALSASGQIRAPGTSGRIPRPVLDRNSGVAFTRPITSKKAAVALGPTPVAATSRFQIPQKSRWHFALPAALVLGGLLSAGVWAAFKRPSQTPRPLPSAAAVKEEPAHRLEGATDLTARLARSAREIERVWAEPYEVTEKLRERINKNLNDALELLAQIEANPDTAATRQRAKALLTALHLIHVVDPAGLADGPIADIRKRVLPQDARLVVLAYNLDSGPAPGWLGPQREACRTWLLTHPSLDAPTDRPGFLSWLEVARALHPRLSADNMGHLSIFLGARYLKALSHLAASGPLPATDPNLAYLAASFCALREIAMGRRYGELQARAIYDRFRKSPFTSATDGLRLDNVNLSDDIVREHIDEMPVLQPFRVQLRELIAVLPRELRVFLMHPPLVAEITRGVIDSARGVMRCAHRCVVDLTPVVTELDRFRDAPGWFAAAMRAWALLYGGRPGWKALGWEVVRRTEASCPPQTCVDRSKLVLWFELMKLPLEMARDQRANSELSAAAKIRMKPLDEAFADIYGADVEQPELGRRLMPLLAQLREAEEACGLITPALSSPGPRPPAPPESAAPAPPALPSAGEAGRAPTSSSPTPAPPSSR